MMISRIERFAFIVLVFVVGHAQSDLLEKIDVECTRQCESHFSGASCWEKSFTYFSNHLIQSLVEYANANINTRPSLDITSNVFQAYEKFRNDVPKDVPKEKADPKSNQQFVERIVQDLDVVFDEMIKKIQKISEKPISNKKYSKCPINCKDDSLTIWKSLFGALVGLTSISVLFMAGYIIFSKVQYRTLKKTHE